MRRNGIGIGARPASPNSGRGAGGWSRYCRSAAPRPPSGPASGADAPACTISAKLATPCCPWLGAESGGYGQSGFRAAMLEHEAKIGRQLDIVHEYLGAGNVVLTNDILTLARRANTIALVNWRVLTKWADGTGGSATVNSQIERWARQHQGARDHEDHAHRAPRTRERHPPGGRLSCPGSSYSGSAGKIADYVGSGATCGHASTRSA